MRRPAVFALIALAAAGADARTHRSHAEKAAFQREHPCPSTGQRRGRCPGYVIDHHVALCVGGEDSRQNMRWQTVDAARAKDRWECRPGWKPRLQACEAARSC